MGVIGVLLGIVFIIWLSMKNISIIIVAPLATFLVIICNHLSASSVFLNTDEQSFMFYLANYVLKYFWIFLLGSLLANLMEESKATDSIARTIIQKIGVGKPYHILVAIFIISFVLTLGGISLFVAMFAIIPLARVLFQRANISWHLIQIPLWLGICTVTMTIFPGTPSIQNIIPITYLNTSLTAAFIPSLLGSFGCVAFGLWYMHVALKKSQLKGQDFSTFAILTEEMSSTEEVPPFWKSITPLAVLILASFVGSIFGNDFLKKNIIYFGLLAAVLLCILFFHRSLPSLGKNLNKGATGAVLPIFSTAMAVAFGSIVVHTAGFKVIEEQIFSLPVPAYINLGLLAALMSGITGSSSGSLGIIMPNYASYYLDLGLDKEMLHRIAAIGTNILTIVPHSGVFITFISLTKLSPKTGFKESFLTVFGSTLVAEIIVTTWALVIG